MRLLVLAVGERPPAWVREAWADYARRIPKPWTPELVELAPGARGGSRDLRRALDDEGRRVLAALPRAARLILLDEHGHQDTSAAFAGRLAAWARDGRDVALAIGGPDGHAAAVRERAESALALSALTLPHALVRVVLVEQLYRTWTLTVGHPYHRA